MERLNFKSLPLFEGVIYTIEEYRGLVNDGILRDFTGTGYFATNNSISNLEVNLEDIQTRPIWATQVVWYDEKK